jgi:hypothetical protein
VTSEFYGQQVGELFRTSGGTGPLPGRVWEEFEVHPATPALSATG